MSTHANLYHQLYGIGWCLHLGGYSLQLTTEIQYIPDKHFQIPSVQNSTACTMNSKLMLRRGGGSFAMTVCYACVRSSAPNIVTPICVRTPINFGKDGPLRTPYLISVYIDSYFTHKYQEMHVYNSNN